MTFKVKERGPVMRKVLACGCVMTWQRNEDSREDYALVAVATECGEKHRDEMEALPGWVPQAMTR